VVGGTSVCSITTNLGTKTTITSIHHVAWKAFKHSVKLRYRGV
jgi:hypothetical protein